MEGLLQSVASVRKDFEERRKSRLELENSKNFDWKLQILSPSPSYLTKSNFSKPNCEKPLISGLQKQSPDEFTKFWQSPVRTNESITKTSRKGYKKDAALLLAEKIKDFILKHFRI